MFAAGAVAGAVDAWPGCSGWVDFPAFPVPPVPDPCLDLSGAAGPVFRALGTCSGFPAEADSRLLGSPVGRQSSSRKRGQTGIGVPRFLSVSQLLVVADLKIGSSIGRTADISVSHPQCQASRYCKVLPSLPDAAIGHEKSPEQRKSIRCRRDFVGRVQGVWEENGAGSRENVHFQVVP